MKNLKVDNHFLLSVNNQEKYSFSIKKTQVVLAIAYFVFIMILLYLLLSRTIGTDIFLGTFLLGFGAITVILLLTIRGKK